MQVFIVCVWLNVLCRCYQLQQIEHEQRALSGAGAALCLESLLHDPLMIHMFELTRIEFADFQAWLSPL